MGTNSSSSDPSDHSPIGGSAAPRYVPCNASVQMQLALPALEVDDTDADEGTVTHWCGANVLQSYLPGGSIITCVSMVGQVEPTTGLAVTAEMAQHADMYVKDVLGIVQRVGGLKDLKIEQMIKIPRVHADCFSTPDCSLLVNVEGQWYLFLWDFKYGHHTVKAFENWQNIEYAAGLIPQDEDCQVVMRIVQPRGYHAKEFIREWRMHATALRPFINQLSVAAHSALGESPDLHAGPHCRDCTALYGCPAAAESAASAIDVVETMHVTRSSPAELGTEVAYLRRAKEALDLRLGALETEGSVLLKAGKTAGSLMLERNRSTKKWDAPVEQIFAMGDTMGVELRKPATPIAPGKAEALVGKDMVKAFTKEIPGSLRLEVMAGALARETFGAADDGHHFIEEQG